MVDFGRVCHIVHAADLQTPGYDAVGHGNIVHRIVIAVRQLVRNRRKAQGVNVIAGFDLLGRAQGKGAYAGNGGFRLNNCQIDLGIRIQNPAGHHAAFIVKVSIVHKNINLVVGLILFIGDHVIVGDKDLRVLPGTAHAEAGADAIIAIVGIWLSVLVTNTGNNTHHGLLRLWHGIVSRQGVQRHHGQEKRRQQHRYDSFQVHISPPQVPAFSWSATCLEPR